jgi:hypothetical protein
MADGNSHFVIIVTVPLADWRRWVGIWSIRAELVRV